MLPTPREFPSVSRYRCAIRATRVGRVVCHEVLRELIAQVLRGGRVARQDIERFLTFADSGTANTVAQKHFRAKVVAVRIEVEAAWVRRRPAVGQRGG